jgi:D-threo-aldose 1-dehydrogenase
MATGAVEGATYNYRPAPPEVLARVARIDDVCRRHGVPLAAAALQFPLAHPAVQSVIPGARSVDEVRANLALLRAHIPGALWADLRAAGLLHPNAPTPS